MAQRLMLIVAIVLGQLQALSGACAAARAAPVHETTCCGSACACDPAACPCSIDAPGPSQDRPANPIPYEGPTTRAPLLAMLALPVALLPSHQFTADSQPIPAGDMIVTCTPIERCSRLCVWLT